MQRLTQQARDTIRAAGLTLVAYRRHWFADGGWHGDSCGCPDDRCIGYHHDAEDECGCLPVTLSEAVQAVAADAVVFDSGTFFPVVRQSADRYYDPRDDEDDDFAQNADESGWVAFPGEVTP